MPCPYTHLHLEAACLPKTSPRPSPKGEGGLMARRQGLLSLSFSSVSSASEHMGARNRTPTSPGHQCPGYSKEPPEGDSELVKKSRVLSWTVEAPGVEEAGQGRGVPPCGWDVEGLEGKPDFLRSLWESPVGVDPSPCRPVLAARGALSCRCGEPGAQREAAHHIVGDGKP